MVWKLDGGEGGCGDAFNSIGACGKASIQTSTNLVLKTLIEEAVTTEAGSLFQYFTTLTENACGSHLGKLCRVALLGRFACEVEVSKCFVLLQQ